MTCASLQSARTFARECVSNVEKLGANFFYPGRYILRRMKRCGQRAATVLKALQGLIHQTLLQNLRVISMMVKSQHV